MEFVKTLRELWRRKHLVALVLIASLLVGFFLAFRPGIPPKSRQYDVSIAVSDILIDTSNSQVVAVGGRSPDLPTLAGRANLLGNLMTSGPLKNAIAKEAGIPAGKIVVVPPANPNTPGIAPAPVKPPASQNVSDADAVILTLSTDETLPILHAVAQAPDLATARRLSHATIVGLRAYLGSVAAAQDIPAAHQLVVRKFGAPLATKARRGLPRRYALAAMIVLAALGCGAILGGSWFIRSWKQIEDAENRGRTQDEEPSNAPDANFRSRLRPADPQPVRERRAPEQVDEKKKAAKPVERKKKKAAEPVEEEKAPEPVADASLRG